MLGAVRALKPFGCAIETLRAALNVLATAAPDWLRQHAGPAWTERYERRADDIYVPKGEAVRRAFGETVGRDGEALLKALTAPDAPSWLREVPAVEVLRRVWVQTFCWIDDEADPGKPPALRWRTEAEGFPPSTLMIALSGDMTN